MLKKNALNERIEECQRVFNRIKEYLSASPVSVPPREKIPLLLYLLVSENAFGCVLKKHDETGEDTTEIYPKWRLFFYGAVNFKGSGIGAVLVSETGQHYSVTAKLRFLCTNNMAEYEACILGLKLVLDMGVRELLVIGDSDLLIRQIRGEWPHPDQIYIDPLEISLKEQPAHCVHVEEKPDGKPWYYDIKRRTPDLGFLRCIDAAEANILIKEVHTGICGPHMNGFALSIKILRTAWGMDVIRPIEPLASNGHRFILVSIDYFTKWVEAASYRAATKKVVADFIRNNLICWFGVPEAIITDNEENLNSHLMKEICDQFKIVHRNSTAYHPQMNGVVEAANKNIKKILRNMVENDRSWHEMLPYALLGYRTIVRTSTEVTLYLLVYGNEVVIPAKVEIPSLRISQEARLSNEE
ncbi:uncharacterized protein LOC124888975 [Capsicum annuum]|uniref:uncharacterized protein LOC124888975 n=1 Tax=Capsicum annuum TaxID=4072 RepID=UPI001FB09DA5|nr:uncharacterized protein LOC124888975 [Capsicum annuum]